MTIHDASFYRRLALASMSPASSDKRFMRSLRERHVVACGLTEGERAKLHVLAHKYRRQISRPLSGVGRGTHLQRAAARTDGGSRMIAELLMIFPVTKFGL
jgi:hypothetical protein